MEHVVQLKAALGQVAHFLAAPLVRLDPGGEGNGTASEYPWNRRRLLEDCIEILDDVIDFDDFVDTVALDRVTCDRVTPSELLPPALRQVRCQFA